MIWNFHRNIFLNHGTLVSKMDLRFQKKYFTKPFNKNTALGCLYEQPLDITEIHVQSHQSEHYN